MVYNYCEAHLLSTVLIAHFSTSFLFLVSEFLFDHSRWRRSMSWNKHRFKWAAKSGRLRVRSMKSLNRTSSCTRLWRRDCKDRRLRVRAAIISLLICVNQVHRVLLSADGIYTIDDSDSCPTPAHLKGCFSDSRSWIGDRQRDPSSAVVVCNT